MDIVLEFERPIVELSKRIEQLRDLQEANGVDLSASIEQLEVQSQKLEQRIFTKLSPWQRTQLSRHPKRPYTMCYVDALFLSGMNSMVIEQAMTTSLSSRGLPGLTAAQWL